MLDLYKNIKSRRIELGYTQQQLADLVGYKGKSMIAQIEKGCVDLSSTMITKFAEALKTTESTLMGWDEAEHTEENARALGSVIHDARLMDHVKKMLAMDETKKEAVYSYTDFLLANN